jgi:hypothetical protein
MDLEELSKLAKTLTEKEFSARFPHLFLLLHQANDGISPLAFHTEVIDLEHEGAAAQHARPRPHPSAAAAAGLRIVALVKAPSSPYPDRVSIGRARNCDVVLRDASISKLHAHVRAEPDGSFVLIDLGSHNGTKIHDDPLPANQPAPVRTGDVVTIGGVKARVADAPSVRLLLTRLSV